MKKLLAQFFKFGIVGLSNTAIYFAIYYVLVLLGVSYLFANVFAFVIGVLNSLYWNKKFVFKDSEKSLPKLLMKIYAAYGFTFFLSTVALFFMVEIMQISEYIAPIFNICITVPINFLINKFWVFR